MNLQRKELLIFLAAAILAGAGAEGQTQDSSGNGFLKGNYAFRYLASLEADANGNPTEMYAFYGTIVFDGAGNYTASGTTVDNTYQSGQAVTGLSFSGTYAIGANGFGSIDNPGYLIPAIPLYGAVSQGVFTGSSTEASAAGVDQNDIFVAIPITGVPASGNFTAAYQTGLLDFTGGGVSSVKNALFKLSANGAGGFAPIALNGHSSSQTGAVTQTLTGATYSFNSDGSATLTIPQPSGSATYPLFTGQKTMFVSADGNFILGWSAGGYDIFFGIKALAVIGSNALTKGLYFNSALEFSGEGVDSYYGSISNSGDSAGDAVVHARANYPGYYSYDYGLNDLLNVNSDGSTTTDLNGYDYLFGDGGLGYVGIGTGGFYSLVIGMHAASFTGGGVFLNPIGVVNAASYQPITARLAPGELITLFGSGLSAVSMAMPGGASFPTTLGGVKVTIDGLPCAIYYVMPGQIAVTVPYELSSNTTGLANIQVNNNGVLSNVVQMYFQDSAPGVLSQTENGLGYAIAAHTATGALVTQANPAQPGEYIALYLTGLGTVTPSIADGAPGPASTLSNANVNTMGDLYVYFDDYGPNGTSGNQGKITFAGLAPGLAGLYQINVQVPTTGLAAGDNVYVELATVTTDNNQIQIPYGTATSTGSSAWLPVHQVGRSVRAGRRPKHRIVPSPRGGVPGCPARWCEGPDPVERHPMGREELEAGSL